MTRKLRVLALAATLLLSISACAKTITSSPSLVPIVTSVPESAATEAPPAAFLSPTPDAAGDAEPFRALDREIFLRRMAEDGYTRHQLLSDPSAYGLDSEGLAAGWGEFAKEESEAYRLESAAYLERLLAIPRSGLNARDQLSYDILQQYLEDASAENAYAYYAEPLTEYDGLHAALPWMLGLFRIADEKDVEDYLLLLEDAPRYLGELLAYEQKKAEKGLFMTESALDRVMKDILATVDARNSFYLIDTFNEAVDKLGSLDAARAEGYKARNETCVKGAFMDAYRDLYRGLDALRGSCRAPAGLCALGAAGADYFEYAMQLEGSNRLSAEESLELLKEELFYSLAVYLESNEKDQAAGGSETPAGGGAQADVERLRAMSESLLFPLPAHTLRLSGLPAALEADLGGAICVIPRIDDWMNCELLVGTAYAGGDQLLSLAYESYPGKLFRCVYQRSLTDTGLMQRALSFGGYEAGWPLLAEYLTAADGGSLSSAASKTGFYDGMILDILLPGIVSIYVNYYGYNADGVRTYLESLNIGCEVYTDVYYNLAIEQPLYTLGSAVGYAQLSTLLRDAAENIGEGFDRAAFLKAYLDLGPGYFNLLQERMDVWVDENTPE